MMDDIDCEGFQTNKMRLRPITSISRDEMIQKNLMPLQENISKKKRAQAHYYEKHIGQSPLCTDSEDKAPVHARLGLVHRNKRRVPLIGTNTTSILPRSRLNYNKDNNNRRIFSAQNRLHRIRQQYSNQPSLFLTSNSKRIHLQRNVPSFKVQVVNDAKEPQMYARRFQMRLNADDQAQIRQIQLSRPREIIHGVHPIIPVATSLTMNERFSHLS